MARKSLSVAAAVDSFESLGSSKERIKFENMFAQIWSSAHTARRVVIQQSDVRVSFESGMVNVSLGSLEVVIRWADELRYGEKQSIPWCPSIHSLHQSLKMQSFCPFSKKLNCSLCYDCNFIWPRSTECQLNNKASSFNTLLTYSIIAKTESNRHKGIQSVYLKQLRDTQQCFASVKFCSHLVTSIKKKLKLKQKATHCQQD